MKIISRIESKEQKLTRYFTGESCKRNHIEERLTSSGECLGCKRAREDRKYKQGLTGHKQYYIDNRETLLKQQQINDDKRRDEKILYGRQWRSINASYAQEYRKMNAGLYAFHSSLRRKRSRIATPSWANFELIRQIYLECEKVSKLTGIEHHVDHIIPLKGKKVSGLHIHTNLQIITKTENLSKHNKF